MFHSKTLYTLVAFLTLTEASVRFTNFQCKELHSDFATFPICRLQIVKRATVALSLHCKLWQVPVNNVSVNLSVYKKASGYRPFLYNISVDFCKFLRNRKQQPFLKFVSDIILKDSNINHTCPYDHDIIVSNLILREDMFEYLPVPEGDYMLQFKVGAYNEWKADIKVFMLIELSLGGKF